MEKRVFLIVLDSFGIGAEPDAAAFGDEGTNTLGAIAKHPNFNCPNLQKMGMFNIDGVTAGEKTAAPIGSFARLQEQSMGKDTTIGHWEIAGVVSPKPLPTFPNGFPDELIHEFEEKTGHKVLCNKPYSGTQVLKNRMSREYVRQENAGADKMELEKYTLGSLRRAVFEGDTTTGSLMAGQVAGMLHEVRPVADILADLWNSGRQRIAALSTEC